MNPLAIAIVFRQRVPQKAQIKKISRDRLKFEWRLIALIKRTGVGPDPAEAVFFEEMNNRALMPAGVAELNRKPEIRGQLGEEIAQTAPFIAGRVGGWKLNQDHREFGSERLERPEEIDEERIAIAQPPLVRDLPGQLAGEAKIGRGHLQPTPCDRLGRGAVKGGIDFDRRKVMGVEFQPAVCRQVGRVKWAAPFLKAPSAGSDANFLLLDQLQNENAILAGINLSQSIR